MISSSGQQLLTSLGLHFKTLLYMIYCIENSFPTSFDCLPSIKTTLYTAIKANQELIPSILTLALNDSMTYDKPTTTGGPNGSIRFNSEIQRPENKGLSAALSLVEEAKKEIDSYSKGGPISYSDLIQLAGKALPF
nr:thylakoid lumenal 29 kDa protein, chloroplastic [Tanacetum cinerariifolium]